MRLLLNLTTNNAYPVLPFNYQYPLSAAIYKIIRTADEKFAQFLHDIGYGDNGKNFKLFTFSDIRTPFDRKGDRMLLTTNQASLSVCFFMPEAAETFIKGLFINQHLEIADTRSKAVFYIHQVQAMQTTFPENGFAVLQPTSPLVVGKKNEAGNYDYRSPEDPDFVDCLLYNWLEKYAAVYGRDEDVLSALKKEIDIKVILFPHPPQQRLITIKADTTAETKIRGYLKFRLQVKAPEKMLELALGAGMGVHCSQGMGCLDLVNHVLPAAAS